MTYDELDERLGTHVLRCTYKPGSDELGEYRFLLFKRELKGPPGPGQFLDYSWGVYEYSTDGFPPPNDPHNEDVWLRNAREMTWWGTTDEALKLTEGAYWTEVWGDAGKVFAEEATQVIKTEVAGVQA